MQLGAHPGRLLRTISCKAHCVLLTISKAYDHAGSSLYGGVRMLQSGLSSFHRIASKALYRTARGLPYGMSFHQATSCPYRSYMIHYKHIPVFLDSLRSIIWIHLRVPSGFSLTNSDNGDATAVYGASHTENVTPPGACAAQRACLVCSQAQCCNINAA